MTKKTQIRRGRVVAWSPMPDAELERDAAAWALWHGLKLEKIVCEREMIFGPKRVRTRELLASIEVTRPAVILTRAPFAHPEIPDLAQRLTADGVQLLTFNLAPAGAKKPLVIPAEVERRLVEHQPVAQRLWLGRVAGAQAGFHQSGPAPYGYKRAYVRGEGRKAPVLVIDESEAETVRLIFREYLRRRSMQKLLDLLASLGSRTRRKKRWSRAGVSWILKNSTYLGRVHFGDVRVKGHHPAIISPIIFNRAQKLIKKNNKCGGKSRTVEPSAV